MARNIPLQTRSAKLSEQFGYDYAVRLFGQEAVDGVPLLKAGPNKGKPKGFVHWRKALVAGYVRECSGPRKVGQLVDAWIGEHPGTTRDQAMRGQWLGRIQAMAGCSDILTAEYRQWEIENQEKIRRENAEIYAELKEAALAASDQKPT